ncbi:MAG: hypothetical protein QOI74_2912 [Micromonosporaceae bacterium]|jgi:GT2 family glycosyltransferase|nr:hypothetical protein [Micromonosporaceae bacterium]
MSKVTIVVATRNRAQALSDSLDRLLALPESPAVIVVDNGSTDSTAAMVTRRFPAVRLLSLRANEGAVARNHGVAAAATPYVAFADDDSWWEAGSLAEAEALFDSHPALALIAARTVVGPAARTDSLSDFMATAPLGWPDELPGPAVLGFLACSAVVRRDAFLRAGGFDPVVFFMGEEARLAYDLRAAGWGLAYCEQVIAHHHPIADGSTPAKAALALRNRALTAWMRRPVPVAISATGSLLRTGVASTAGRRALVGFAARLPRALAARTRPHPTVEADLDGLAAAENGRAILAAP